MTSFQEDWDQWPCGLVVMDGSGQVQKTNATLRRWLGIDVEGTQDPVQFVDILSRAGRIYFETHLRPLLLVKGEFSEIAIDLERKDGTRVGVFINGCATLADDRMVSAHFSIFQNTQRQSFERELVAKRRESDAFKSLVRSSPYAIVAADENLVIQEWNNAAERLFGHTSAEVIGQRLDALLIPAEDIEKVPVERSRVHSGETVRNETLRRHKDGTLVQVEKSIAPILDDAQKFSGFVAIYSDISARKSSEAQLQTLMQEVNHRSKNMLSVVQVIARQTARLYEGADFISMFNNRLASLTSNQDLLINGHGDHVDLETIARAQFAHLIDAKDPRVTIEGPTIHLDEAVSQAMGMAIFELVTNAAKYGALSHSDGKVALTWTITDETPPNFDMSWVEADGPAVTKPTRKGFGFQVTGPILEGITSGKTNRDYAEKGFRWSLRAPYRKPSEQVDRSDSETDVCLD